MVAEYINGMDRFNHIERMRLVKDKVKGLLVGLALGTMMTGTLTYATTSTDIGVYFRELKYAFDGVEKQPPAEQQGFIYNDTTYVPLRFIAESLGKEVNFDNDTGSIWIGKNYGGAAATPVATYIGGEITQVELDTYLSAYTFFYSQSGVQPGRQQMLPQLIGIELLASRADDTARTIAEQSAVTEFANIVKYFGSVESLETNLKSLKLTVSDVKSYLVQSMLTQQVLSSMVDDQAVQAEYERKLKADSSAFVTATIRHILIGTNTGTATRTDAEALARVKEVQDKLAKGTDFAELAKIYSDDEGTKNAGGRLPHADIADYVEGFKKAAAELPLNKLSDPVKTEFGYHLLEVEKRETKSPDQAKNQLKSQMMVAAFQRIIMQEVPGLIQSTTLTSPQK